MDVVVWPAPGPASPGAAAAAYAELRASPPVHPAVRAFVRELVQMCPDPGSDVPWSAALTVGADAVIVHVVWPEPRRVLDLVQLLAARHGLVCYLPSGQVVPM